MTAEIAVMNLAAVALAADSAVTAGGKIYNTVNKLFTLSKYHPVGIMVYGNAQLAGVPFETIIKAARQKRGAAPEATIKDYAAKFLQELNDTWIDSKHQQELYARALLDSGFRQVADVLRDVAATAKGGERNKRAAITRRLQVIRKNLDGRETFASLAATDPKDVRSAYASFISDALQKHFKDLALTNPGTTSVESIGVSLLMKDVGSDLRSGIVIAGFGETEYFPRLVELSIDGVVLGKIRSKESQYFAPDRDGGVAAAIVPFAQTDMMGRFMEGIDRKYNAFISQLTRKTVQKFGSELIDKYVTGVKRKETAHAEVGKTVDLLCREFSKLSAEYRRKEFSDPVMYALNSLPKDELAGLAEAMVNLTSLKRRVSTNERETVGGAVDVAVISKGDGLIWVKRKHYFAPELNQHFAANYFR